LSDKRTASKDPAIARSLDPRPLAPKASPRPRRDESESVGGDSVPLGRLLAGTAPGSAGPASAPGHAAALEAAGVGTAAPLQHDWTNILFIASAHLLAIGAIAWLALVQASPWTIGLGVLWYLLCGFAITGGYHRHFAHPTYRANVLVRLFYLLFGAAAVQNSAIRWSADHRRHHARTDQDLDPYNITRGFWWAHMGWVFFKDPTKAVPRGVDDLMADRLVAFQHRYYIPLAILVSLVVPGLLGLLWGDPIGAILVACFLRLVLQWHATGAVNSVAHWMGSRPYSRAISARDSFVTAIVTMGEGYHNFHHRFQLDYRNGVRWYQFDPTKWIVWTFERVGLAWGLRRTAPETIQQARETVLAEVRAQRSGR